MADAEAIPLRGVFSVMTLLRRVATAVVAVPVLAWVVAGAPPLVFPVVVVAVSAVASWELARMLRRAGRATYPSLAVASGAALTASFLTPLHAVLPTFPTLILTVSVAAIVSAPVWMRSGPNAEAVANTSLGLVYLGWLLGYLILLHRAAGGPGLVLFVVGVTWCGESAAYLVGSAVGRHRLAPVVSPGKTVEGGVAQVVASIAGAYVLAGWLLPECSTSRAGGAGALIGVVGQIGDLAESAIKRSAGVKDASGLIPGHGGLLDRLDSLLFNAPAFYYYWMFAGCAR